MFIPTIVTIITVALTTIPHTLGSITNDCKLASEPTPKQVSQNRLTRQQFHQMYCELTESEVAPFFLEQTGYTRTKKIGTGTFSGVYLFTDATGKERPAQVAVKVVHNVDKDPEWFNLNIKEVYVLKALQHENIMTIHSGYANHKQMVIISDYYAGGSLEEYEVYNAKFGGLSEVQVKDLVKGLLRALSHMHHYGVYHRDIKPANIMLTEDLKPVLIDFGLCTEPTADKPGLWSDAVGSPLFVAPEVWMRRPYGGSVDIWSLGITVFMLHADAFATTKIVFTDSIHFSKELFKRKGPWNGWEAIPGYLKSFMDGALVFEAKRRMDADFLLPVILFEWNHSDDMDVDL